MATQRVTARVLPVSPDDAVLLLEEQDPARAGARYWSSIGGALEEGESPPAAAVREAHEESGIILVAADLIGPVTVHRQAYSWGGVDYDGQHTYFAVHLAGEVEVSLDGLEPEEIGNVFGAAWWTPEALLDSGSRFEPPVLPDIMRAAIVAARETR